MMTSSIATRWVTTVTLVMMMMMAMAVSAAEEEQNPSSAESSRPSVSAAVAISHQSVPSTADWPVDYILEDELLALGGSNRSEDRTRRSNRYVTSWSTRNRYRPKFNRTAAGGSGRRRPSQRQNNNKLRPLAVATPSTPPPPPSSAARNRGKLRQLKIYKPKGVALAGKHAQATGKVSSSSGRRMRNKTMSDADASQRPQSDSAAAAVTSSSVSTSAGSRLTEKQEELTNRIGPEGPNEKQTKQKAFGPNAKDVGVAGGGSGVSGGPAGGRHYSSDVVKSCEKMKCLRGGQCVMDPAPRCRCPLGTKGRHCEQDVIVRHPLFDGDGFLALPAPRAADRQLSIDLEFRPDVVTSSPLRNVTSSGNMLLLFGSDRDDAQFDFFSIVVTSNGQVEFRFDCGTGMGIARTKNRVRMGEWNKLRVHRMDWTAYVQLNNGPDAGAQSKGLFSKMSFRREMFVGGFSDISKCSLRTGASVGFSGCVRRLEINTKLYDMRKGTFVGDSLYGIGVDECSAGSCQNVTCYNGGSCVTHGADSSMCLCPLWTAGKQCQSKIDVNIPSFNGHSYMQYLGLRRSLLTFANIELVFRPADPDGLLLYNGYATDGAGDFISLAMRNQTLEYRFDLGTGPAVIRSSEPVSLNEWHTVRVLRHGRHGSLQVDGQPSVNGTAAGAFTQLTLTLDLFLGGHRNYDEIARNADASRAFTGCIQKLVINDKVMRLVTDALTGVNIDDCSDHPCSGRPCQNGGLCVPLRDNFRCRCPVGFESANCEIRTARYRYRYRYRRHSTE